MRILVIEDEAEIRDFLKSSLEEECFAVDAAENGEEGEYLALTNNYDLIILDYILPGKNGFEICKTIRESGKQKVKQTPIMMLSVKTDVDQKVKLLMVGADDYLTKPFSFKELLARIRTILRRPPEIKEEELSIDNLRLDTQKQAVTRGEKRVYLTRKEFILLEYFLRNKGRVLSRGMIMEHVWNSDGDLFSNTIEAHVLNLRKKIDVGFRKKLIHSVPGRGYKIDLQR